MSSSGSLSSETLSHRNHETLELRAHKDKTRTQCGTMESCLTFPQFHITAATRKMVILYIIETALKKQRQRQRILLTAKHRKEIMENGM